MNTTIDNELDNLIAEAFRREELTEEIVKRVEKSLQRRKRHAAWKRWAAIVVFSFALPAVVVAVLNVYYFLFRHYSGEHYIYCFVFPAAALLYIAAVVLQHTSVDEFFLRE